MPSSSVDPKITFRDPALVQASFANLAITLVRGQIRRDHLPEIVRAYQSLARIHPKGLVSITVIAPGVPISDADTRAEASRTLEAVSGSIRHISVVLEGGGIWAGTMRTVLRGISLIARSRLSMKVHDDVSSAARAAVPVIAELTESRPSEAEIVTMLHRLMGESVAARESAL